MFNIWICGQIFYNYNPMYNHKWESMVIRLNLKELKKKKKPPKSGACALIWLNTSYLDIVNINRLRALLNFMGSGAWSFLVG